MDVQVIQDLHTGRTIEIETSLSTSTQNNILGIEQVDSEENQKSCSSDLDSFHGFDQEADDDSDDRNYVPSEESEEESSSNESSSGQDTNIEMDHNSQELLQNEVKEDKTKLIRKRLRKADTWKKNIRKQRRNLGQDYVSAKGKKICPRKMGEVCSEKCRIKCISKISDEERKAVFNYYWKLGSVDAQRVYINSCMTEISPTYRCVKPGSNRSKNFKYSFTINNKQIQVCKTYFKNTLGINNRVIFTTSKKRDEHGMVKPDLRGKSNKNRIAEEVKNGIRNHILSFPTISSHYCRARTNKTYVDGSLNIQMMYRLYVEHCKNSHREYAKLATYRQILNTETNIGFHTPKKDMCSLCENYKNANQEAKDSMKEKFEKHMKEKELSRKEKSKDVEENDNVQVYCYDLQSVLTTPLGDVNSFYYKKKLATYNFTVYDVKNKLGLCYVWHEAIAKRGANEISSCIFKFIANQKHEHLVFYSDNCVGQNKNRFVFGMYLYCTQKFENIKSITHKFLIVGHTQNEGDSMHALIEREKKRVLKSGPIYVPSQWSVIIRSAKKQGHPYTVDEISTNDIFDFKKLVSNIGNNFTKNTDGEKVTWKDVKIVKVEKDHPYIIFYKTSYDQLLYKQIKIRNSLRTNSIATIKLTSAYSKPPPISAGKKQHLLEMCKEGAIKEVHWPFYESLETSNAMSEPESDSE